MNSEYLNNVKKQFGYYKSVGEKTFDQLEEKDLFWQYDEVSNSIAIIVNHLWGNMLSRFTDFLDSDGEKPWRDRDREFEAVIQTKEELLKKWNEGWSCLIDALEGLKKEDLESRVFIRNQEHAVHEALNRQLAHYAYHIGQIVCVGKMIKGQAWKSLTIPRGRSDEFNRAKTSKGKHKGHYTDDLQ